MLVHVAIIFYISDMGLLCYTIRSWYESSVLVHSYRDDFLYFWQRSIGIFLARIHFVSVHFQCWSILSAFFWWRGSTTATRKNICMWRSYTNEVFTPFLSYSLFRLSIFKFTNVFLSVCLAVSTVTCSSIDWLSWCLDSLFGNQNSLSCSLDLLTGYLDIPSNSDWLATYSYYFFLISR